MSWLTRLANVVRKERVERDLDDEMQSHLEERTAEFIREGMPAREAQERARRQFGNRLLLRESSREIKLLPRLDSLLRDLGFGLRLCRRNKVATAAAVISLSLAIGASTAAFSLIDALILRPLPVNDPAALIYLGLRAPGSARDGLSFNYPLFERLRDASRSQVQLFAMSDQSKRDAIFDGSDQPDKVYGQWVSGDALSILGVKPALGRLLTRSDDLKPGQHPVAVLSYDFWTRRFGRNPGVLGRWLTIREKQLQIVGVMEEGFTGVEPGIMTDLWAPTMMWDDRAISDSGTRWFRIWGRMQPETSRESVRAVLQTVFSGFQREQAALRPADEPRERIEALLNTAVHLRSAANGPSSLRQDFEQALWILATVAVLVLLIACSNVASLLLARAGSREREMALRISIGAGRGRLIQQMLLEGALISIASCVLGLLIAVTTAPKIVSMLSTSRSTVRLDLQIDWRLLVFLAAAGSLVTFLFGLLPALRASTISPIDALKSGSGKQTARIGLFRPLVAAQTAFCFVVLFVAGLCLTSFARLTATELGFDAGDLTVMNVEARELRQADTKPLAVWQQLVERLSVAPGVESASLSSWGLFEGSGRNKSVRIPGRAIDAYDPWYLRISPRFLKTMRIPLIEGRDLEWRDALPEVPTAVIVNESFARRYFPGESPLGKRFFRLDGPMLVAQDIVGVAADARYTSLREPAPPTVYDPHQPASLAAVQVRTRLGREALSAVVRDELRRVHPALRLAGVTPQATLVENTLVRDRALALLSGFFSLVAMILVAVGLYGVLSYSVVQRTREIGIRLALGARPLRVIGLVVSELAIVTTIGLIVGVGGGMAAAEYITTLLYQVKPSDTWSVAAPLVCLIIACALSALLPALRATRVSPTTALRYD